MLKYSLLVFVLAVVFYAPHVHAQSALDVLITRIDALILEMEVLKREVQSLKSGGSVATPSVLGAQDQKVFTQSLQYGETNSDIEKIQKLLATDPDIYPYGVASGFFGPRTQEAIRNFQTHFGLDPVGVIGPATTALLEGYFRQYPNGNYPANIFDAKPEVRGASTSVAPTTTTVPSATSVSGSNPLHGVDVFIDHGEAEVEVEYKNGDDKEFIVDSPDEDEDDIVLKIVHRIGVREAFVREVIEFENAKDDNDKNDYDEGDAEDALDEADDAIDDADDAIDEADEDGEDVDYALDTIDEARDLYRDAEDAFDDEDWDEAVELAEEAAELAEKAEDRIGKDERDDDGDKGDSDEIEEIDVDIDEGESEVRVKYEHDSDYVFTVEEDKMDEIVEAVADELDIDEDEVEDVIDFDFGKIDYIDVLIEDGEAEVEAMYKSGVVRRFDLDEDDEDRLIEEIAEELDIDEDDVEDVIDFDYN